MNSCFWTYIFIALVSFSSFSMKVTARPTKEEKSARRSAFWGLLADLYRARTCLETKDESSKCAGRALRDAATHAPKLDAVIGSSEHSIVSEIKSISLDIESNQMTRAKTSLTVLLQGLLHEFAENTAPVLQPSEEMGKDLFQQYCESCHGDGRKQLGKLASKLRHVPKSFAGPQSFSSQLPFGIYAVMIHGVDGGEMASMLDVLSVDELWAVSFYVSALPYLDMDRSIPNEVANRIRLNSRQFALSVLATSTDEDLRNILLKIGPDCGKCAVELNYLRTIWPWTGETDRLGEVAANPRQKAESRALLLLLVAVIFVSGGFIFVLKRSGRVEK